MKIMKALLFAAVAIVALCADAATWTDPETGITWTYKVSNGEASVGGGSSSSPAVPKTTSGPIVIPSTLGGYPVTSIGSYAFSNCGSLTSVTIPNSVTSVGDYAFYGCSSLTSVTIPDSVMSIGSSAFSGCRSLQAIIVDVDNNNYKSLDGLLLSKDGKILVACPGAKIGAVIPDSVTSIENYAFYGCSSLTSVTIPDSVTSIGYCAFFNCRSLTSVTIGESVASIGDEAFLGCSSLTSVTIGKSVTSIGDSAFLGCSSLKKVEFKGAPPIGVKDSKILGYGVHTFPREYGAEWQKLLSSQSKLGGFYQPNKPIVEYVSVKVRENNPTILDCVYRVKSGKPTVKVRALAFKDGGRSFANVVRPETFIEGTDQNIGDAVAANVEHKLSWQVSADWNIDLAKVSFEVLATEDQLLPLELRTIPANGSNKAMEFSWNAITSDQVFTALLWLYADKDAGVALSGGVLKNGSTTLASGASLSNPDASSYVFSKMGFSLLSGSDLTYVNTMSRLGLSPGGELQYAYRWVEK